MEQIMTVDFPIRQEMMTTVRLVTGGICSLSGFGIDDSEDCKLCVTEGLLLLFRRGYRHAQVDFSREKGLCVSLLGTQKGEVVPSEEEEISVALLQAMVEGLQMGSEGEGYRISFTFGE